jgi:hypothetical protein
MAIQYKVPFFDREDAHALLRNWVRLNKELMALPIEGVQELLAYAIELDRGEQLILRLHQRYNRLRRLKEWELLKKGVLPWASKGKPS